MNYLPLAILAALASVIPPASAQTHQQPTADQAVSAAGVGTGLSPAVYVAGTAAAGTLIGLCAAGVICGGGGSTGTEGVGNAIPSTGGKSSATGTTGTGAR